MKETLVVIPTVNNLNYLRQVIDSFHCDYPHQLLVIDNGSTDNTLAYLKSKKNLAYIHYDSNLGVNYANNVAFDLAFVNSDNNLIVIHNDIVLNKQCINNLILGLNNSTYDIIYAKEFCADPPRKSLQDMFANLQYFYELTPEGFSYHKDVSYTGVMVSEGLNFTARAIKKSFFDKIGYADVNFYPAYYCDNDVLIRSKLTDVTIGFVDSAHYLHYRSRSINEGGVDVINNKHFKRNYQFYKTKWGGEVGKETRFGNPKLMRTRDEDYEIIQEKILSVTRNRR